MVVKIYRTFAKQFNADICMPYHKGIKDTVEVSVS